jgi:hypothetical protein
VFYCENHLVRWRYTPMFFAAVPSPDFLLCIQRTGIFKENEDNEMNGQDLQPERVPSTRPDSELLTAAAAGKGSH